MQLDNDLKNTLDAGFSPRGMAIYGATNRAAAMGQLLIGRMTARGYDGNLVFVSQRPQEIAGRQTVTSLGEAEGPVDHALIVVPAESVSAALADAAAAGVKLATIFASGFSEIGAEGADLDRDLRATIAHTGIRVIGPNCLGFINFRDNIGASTLNLPAVTPGPVSIAGQSGSVSARLANGVSATGTGLDVMVTIGNSVDIGQAALVEYLASRETTRVILLYLETLGPPEAMRQAIMGARAAGKEVVVLKSGRTEAGARTAATHTGATASKDVFVDLLLKEAGAIRVKSVQEACDVTSLLSRVGRLKGRALILAPSGGDCTLAADRCSELGIPLAVMSEQAQDAMRAMIPICAPVNPVDPTTMGMKPGAFVPFIEIPASEPDVDYLIFMTSTTLVKPESYENTLAGLYLAQAKGIPVIVGAPVSAISREALAKANIALVEDSERVYEIVRSVLDTTGEADRPRPAEEVHAGPPLRLMGELDALAALRDAGLPMIETRPVANLGELEAAARAFGYPIVLKGILPGTGHKSGLGLVKLDLGNEQALRDAFDDVRAKLEAHGGGTIVVQPAVRGAVAELLLGVVSDPQFGKHVTLGMGGVFTDFLKERAWGRVPVDRQRAGEMLDSLAIGAGLRGERAGVHGHVEGIIDAVVRLSDWALQNDDRIGDVEINPLMVRRGDVVGVDALVVLRDAAGSDQPQQKTTMENAE
ncbi:MAG: Acetyl-CoA synthetase [Caulobacter sp.]|nr:Acetyl-CoA synthetase [Caulobacter sp.]